MTRPASRRAEIPTSLSTTSLVVTTRSFVEESGQSPLSLGVASMAPDDRTAGESGHSKSWSSMFQFHCATMLSRV